MSGSNRAPLPCSLRNARLDLTLASLPMCLSGRDRDTGLLHCTAQITRLIHPYGLATTSATAPGLVWNFSPSSFRSRPVPFPELSWALN